MNEKATIVEQALETLYQKINTRGQWIPVEDPRHTPYDGTLILFIKKQKVEFVVEVKMIVHLYQLERILEAAEFHEHFLVIAGQIADGAKNKLRNKGISYLEANGNAYIDHGDITLIIDGNKPARPPKPVLNRAFTRTGLKAVFQFLHQPEAINWSYRKLADKTGIALGNIKYVIDGLMEAGFIIHINPKELRLKNKAVLLERWLAGYREILKPDLQVGQYKFWNKNQRAQWTEIQVKDYDAQWGGEAAADIMTNYLHAERLTLYVGERYMPVVQRLVLIPATDGDVTLYKRFWKHDETDLLLVPPLLVYTDLMITDEPRNIETAQMIYQQTLKHVIEGD